MATTSVVATSPAGLPLTRAQTLGLWDAISIIIGIVVGAGIYETAPFVLSSAGSSGAALLLWGLGGLLSLIGALCYAELATTYPRSGGDYVYLTRAYGKAVGFLFGWAELSCIMTGSIGMMVYIFAHYAGRLCSIPAAQQYWLAAGAVIVLSGLNLLGIAVGKGAQNLLTLAKVLGIVAILMAGILYGSSARLTETPSLIGKADYRLAMILILYTYGGWNDAAFVAAEQRTSAGTFRWPSSWARCSSQLFTCSSMSPTYWCWVSMAPPAPRQLRPTFCNGLQEIKATRSCASLSWFPHWAPPTASF